MVSALIAVADLHSKIFDAPHPPLSPILFTFIGFSGGACVSSSPWIWHRYGASGDFASIWKVETILDSSLVASAAPAERLAKLHTSLR